MEVTEGKQERVQKTEKKPFNKKKWREQRYSCKAKVQKWETVKRKQIQRQYQREFKSSRSPTKFRDGKNKEESHSSFKQAKLCYREIQQSKEEKRKENERIRKEKIEAIKAYKEKKAARFKKLNQKTRKGQPLMRGRIELLLEKIQRDYVNCSSYENK